MRTDPSWRDLKARLRNMDFVRRGWFSQEKCIS